MHTYWLVVFYVKPIKRKQREKKPHNSDKYWTIIITHKQHERIEYDRNMSRATYIFWYIHDVSNLGEDRVLIVKVDNGHLYRSCGWTWVVTERSFHCYVETLVFGIKIKLASSFQCVVASCCGPVKWKSSRICVLYRVKDNKYMNTCSQI